VITIYARQGLSQGDLAEVTGILKRGGIGIVPTDTVYGIAGLASNGKAVSRIFEVKGRDPSKPLPVQVESTEAAGRLAWITRHSRALAEKFWPGPLTIIMPSRPGTDLPMQDGTSIGIRVPASDNCIRIIRTVGPLVLPSANSEGSPAPAAPEEVERALLGLVDFFIDAGSCPGGVESTVVDAREGIEVLREGAIAAEAIKAVAE
jgi:L-threonylcarbamoyladenylate synthase